MLITKQGNSLKIFYKQNIALQYMFLTFLCPILPTSKLWKKMFSLLCKALWVQGIPGAEYCNINKQLHYYKFFIINNHKQYYYEKSGTQTFEWVQPVLLQYPLIIATKGMESSLEGHPSY